MERMERRECPGAEDPLEWWGSQESRDIQEGRENPAKCPSSQDQVCIVFWKFPFENFLYRRPRRKCGKARTTRAAWLESDKLVKVHPKHFQGAPGQPGLSECGSPGPVGEPGVDGRNGAVGIAGKPGIPGKQVRGIDKSPSLAIPNSIPYFRDLQGVVRIVTCQERRLVTD
jgi:hypothetical protein